MAARAGLYRTLGRAFHAIGVVWDECYHEDRGDGAFVLVPPEIPKELFVDVFPLTLADALGDHAEAVAAWQQALTLNRAQHRIVDVARIERQVAELEHRRR